MSNSGTLMKIPNGEDLPEGFKMTELGPQPEDCYRVSLVNLFKIHQRNSLSSNRYLAANVLKTVLIQEKQLGYLRETETKKVRAGHMFI
jgi:hypothetical protein